MFVSSIKIKGRAEKRIEILQTINGVSEQTRRKRGCLGANSYQDINDENIFYLTEMWQTQEDMDDYLSSKLFAVLLGIKTILVETPEIKILVEDCSYNCDGKDDVQVH